MNRYQVKTGDVVLFFYPGSSSGGRRIGKAVLFFNTKLLFLLFIKVRFTYKYKWFCSVS